jgi:hypothetical protein
MHTKTFSEWLAYKADVFVSQSPEQDREKLAAIFDHFGILHPEAKAYDKKPMTNLEIGYLSPRVPRPLIVEEKIKPVTSPDAESAELSFEDRTLETIAYVTEEGEQAYVYKKDGEYTTLEGEVASLVPEQTVRIFDDRSGSVMTFVYRGMTADGQLAFSRDDAANELVVLFEKSVFEQKIKVGVAKDFEKALTNDFAWYPESIQAICAEENVAA